MCIKFCVKLGDLQSKIIEQIKRVYGNKIDYLWCYIDWRVAYFKLQLRVMNILAELLSTEMLKQSIKCTG